LAFELGKRVNISDEVFDQVYDRILTQDFKPGERLGLASLERELGVSRTPILAALHRLADIGLVQIRPRRGIYVANPSLQEVRDKFEIRKALELYAVRESATKATDEDMQRLSLVVRQMREALRDGSYREFVSLDDRFHNSIVASSKNESLPKVYRGLNVHTIVLRIRYSTPENSTEITQQQHEAILHALVMRDGPEAERRLSDHIERAKDGLLRALQKDAE